MKKLLTIPLALLILLSGMHFTVATHYCGGHLAATKLSFSGKQATCGMIMDDDSDNSTEKRISRQCCDDKITVYQVDKNYAPSTFHFKDISRNILHDFFAPVVFSFTSHILTTTSHTNYSPPDYCMANAVRIADICVFRI